MGLSHLVSGSWPGIPGESFGWLGFLLRHADPSSAAAIAILFFLVVRPVFGKVPFFAADRNRLLLLLIPIGFLFGWWAEYASAGVQLNIVLRRGYAAGAAAVWGIVFARVFCHGINTPYAMMNPDPSASAGRRQ
jgi:hypothetical protein